MILKFCKFIQVIIFYSDLKYYSKIFKAKLDIRIKIGNIIYYC